MAVPKRRTSRSNTRHRRSAWKTTATALVDCANPSCDSKVQPHHACTECGQYGPRGERRQNGRTALAEFQRHGLDEADGDAHHHVHAKIKRTSPHCGNPFLRGR